MNKSFSGFVATPEPGGRLLIPKKVAAAIDEDLLHQSVASFCEINQRNREKQAQKDAEKPSEDLVKTSTSWRVPKESVSKGYVRVITISPQLKDPLFLRTQYRDEDDRARIKALRDLIARQGYDRPLAELPKNWREHMVRLRVDMPNCTAVIDHLCSEFALSEAQDCVPRFSPLLLLGPPGVGKTTFAEALALSLGSGYFRVQMESQETGWTLGGSSSTWSNSATGKVFDALVNGDHANPIFFLDELEKAPRPDRHSSPLAALYTLWEPASARTFTDASMPLVGLDASNILWLATCNSVKTIPAPILSRCTVIYVPPFTVEQGIALVGRVFAQALAPLGKTFEFAPLTEAITEKLARQVPRQLKQVLRTAIGRAVYQGRREVHAEDITAATQVLGTNSKGRRHANSQA